MAASLCRSLPWPGWKELTLHRPREEQFQQVGENYICGSNLINYPYVLPVNFPNSGRPMGEKKTPQINECLLPLTLPREQLLTF